MFKFLRQWRQERARRKVYTAYEAGLIAWYREQVKKEPAVLSPYFPGTEEYLAFIEGYKNAEAHRYVLGDPDNV